MMMLTAGSFTSRRRRFPLFAAIACAVMPVAVVAQTSVKEKPESFSNRRPIATKPVAPSKLMSDVAAEPQTADAIAADVLTRIYKQGDEHFHAGEWNHCINLNQIVMEGDPHNVDTYANNAYLLWSSDRDAQAIETLKKGIAANTNSYYMYDELGMYYWLHHKDAVHALPYYEQAVKFKCPSMTYHGLAHCYEILGHWDKAVEAWQSATGDPRDLVAKVQLKRAKAELARRQNASH